MGLPLLLALFLLDTLVYGKAEESLTNKATVTLQPNWSQMYRGEKITVRCEIQGGGDAEWTYEWSTPRRNDASSQSEFTIGAVTESDTGDYTCLGRRDSFFTKWSETKRLTVSGTALLPTLTAERKVIAAGGSVTLTCSVDTTNSWKYQWFRGTSGSSEPVRETDQAQTVMTQGGVYCCRGRRGEPEFFTEFSPAVILKETVANKATVTLQPNWSQIYRGEKITVRCEIQGGGDAEWTYEWRSNSSIRPLNQREQTISWALSDHSGTYICRGRMKSSRHNTTEWSDSVTLTVNYNIPTPVLTVSPSWLSPGASVTLRCQVERPSEGWRFFWYKTVPKQSEGSYSTQLLPGNSSGTEPDSYILHGQTHTAGYVCRAGRGHPVYDTHYSEPRFVWSGDTHPSASLTVSPDRVQHFTHERMTLSCEGNSTRWRVRKFPEGDPSYSCPGFRRITGSTCEITPTLPHQAVYWCESGSRDFSNSVNITVQNYYNNIILTSPVHPVTEGESVILGCRTESGLSSAFFYHNDKLIQKDSSTELNISAVSKSHEGFYKCQSLGKYSPQSWMAVKDLNNMQSFSFPASLILGLVCGVILVVLLLLLCFYRRSKESSSHKLRPSQSEATGSTANHGGNQGGSQCDLYDTIKESDNVESQVTYSPIEMKNIEKKGQDHKPAETSVDSDLTTGTAENSLLYAHVNIYTKGKDKKKRAPVETDGSIYSEVKTSGTSDGP